jgi:PhnB protein
MSYIIQPWLSVRNSKKALEFYKQAFDAVETYRLDTGDDSVIAKLSINGAEFWLSDESPDFGNFSPETLNGSTTRMILVVNEPEKIFSKAIQAGALEIFPVGEGHGWKLGRIVDPFGHHWEIGHPVENP